MHDHPRCQLCRAAGLDELDGFSRLGRVTSDCRPWPAGGRLTVCRHCGTVQKVMDPQWQDECAAIYRDYAMYSLAGGAEQLVFEAGAAASRSRAIVGRLLDAVAIPETGRLLDIGCGNGAFLAAFGASRPGWELYGAELDDRNRAVLERIPGFRGLHVGDVETFGHRCDMVAMIHALEHIPDPVSFLERIRQQVLVPDGLLLVEVPDHATNPFDLLIADHLVHFSTPALGHALARAGFAPLVLTNQWVAKENSAVARPGPAVLPTVDAAASGVVAARGLRQLEEIAAAAAALAESGPVGVFGTAIGASWLAGRLGDRVAFFVDEDPHRAGRCYLGRPVLAPEAVPDGANVVLPLAPTIAHKIAARLNDGRRRYHAFCPPAET